MTSEVSIVRIILYGTYCSFDTINTHTVVGHCNSAWLNLIKSDSKDSSLIRHTYTCGSYRGSLSLNRR